MENAGGGESAGTPQSDANPKRGPGRPPKQPQVIPKQPNAMQAFKMLMSKGKKR